MADLGHQLTDAELKKLEKRIAREYKTAVKEMQKKLEDYLKKDEAKRKVQEELYKAGKITKKDYQDWCFRHNMMGKRWEEMKDVLAQDMHHTNEVALGIAKGEMPNIYALNGNYATYQLEHDGKIDTGFTLYSHDTAEYLLEQDRPLMPAPSTRKAKQIAANKDLQWNKQKIQSAVLQGVLQGESPYDVAKRLQDVGQMNYNSAVRYARTMTTSAQNAGRYEAFKRADKLGVDLTIEWQATLDGRTRHDHRMMHGQRRNVGEPFVTPEGFEILYPAESGKSESDLPQRLIWNCRCTLLSWVKGFEGDTVKSSPKMGDMSFEEWQREKEPQKADFTTDDKSVTIKAEVSDQNTQKIVEYNPNYDYSIKIERYSDELNKVLSEECRNLAEKGTRDRVEWLSLVGIDSGKVEYSKAGFIDQTETDFWDYLNKNKDKEYVFLHNHVLDGSLSCADLDVLLTSYNVDSMVAVRNDAVKYVAPRNREVPRPSMLMSILYDSTDDDYVVQSAIRDFVDGYYEHDGRK